jgi:2-polyprenyl-3-methyl-5-hydroxy-6-metoxy-1,4-benzoquinol methylase
MLFNNINKRHGMTTFEKQLLDEAIAPYKQAGKFASNFARGKLAGDPVFKEILRRGLIAADSHVIDIGCGQGLLSAWLLAAEHMSLTSEWPENWGAAPCGVSVHGIELMPADVRRAKKALGEHQDRWTFEAGDMCSTAFDKAQTAVILDVLHYVPYDAQEDVLLRVREALSPSGLLILRIGDADGGWGFKVSNWVDNVVTLVRGHSLSRLYCRPLSEWITVLDKLGFKVESKPMSQGTPFSNVLLLAYLNK